jgi:hypothetical protein
VPVKAIVLLASLPIPVLAAALWHIRVYSIYRLFGERWPEIEQLRLQERRQPLPVRRVNIPKPTGDLSYTWFSSEFANPWWMSNFPGYVNLFSSLPEDLAAQVSIARRDTMRAQLIAVCWGVLMIGLVLWR